MNEQWEHSEAVSGGLSEGYADNSIDPVPKKILGNWYFTVATALMAGGGWRLAGSINEKLAEGGDLKCTLIPVIALLLSLPLIPYRKRKQ